LKAESLKPFRSISCNSNSFHVLANFPWIILYYCRKRWFVTTNYYTSITEYRQRYLYIWKKMLLKLEAQMSCITIQKFRITASYIGRCFLSTAPSPEKKNYYNLCPQDYDCFLHQWNKALRSHNI
jgi:hypothetical protein